MSLLREEIGRLALHPLRFTPFGVRMLKKARSCETSAASHALSLTLEGGEDAFGFSLRPFERFPLEETLAEGERPRTELGDLRHHCPFELRSKRKIRRRDLIAKNRSEE